MARLRPCLIRCVHITCRYEWAHSVRLDELDEEGAGVERIADDGGGIAVGGGEGAARRGAEGGSESGGSEAMAAQPTLRGHRVSMVFRDRPAG